MMAVIVISITVGHSLVSSDGFYNGEAPLKMETIEDAGTNLKGWSIYRWAWRRRWWWRWWWWSDGDGIVLPSSSLCSLRWQAATCWNAHHISETLPNCKIKDDNYRWKHLDRIQARRSIIAPHCIQHTLDLRHLITVTQVSLSSPHQYWIWSFLGISPSTRISSPHGCFSCCALTPLAPRHFALDWTFLRLLKQWQLECGCIGQRSYLCRIDFHSVVSLQTRICGL